jgi:hypothetical protein
MAKQVGLGGVLFLSFVAACNTPPPRSWLRYEPNGRHAWVAGPDGQWLTRLHGVDVAMDLNRVQTRVQVTVTNSTSAPIEMRMGAEASSPRGAIGEVLLRALDNPVGVGGPDMVGYNSMQPMVVEAGWRGVWYLDYPLGREPVLGQQFVLTVEGRDAAGQTDRRSMPLIATNAGTMPTDRR